MKNAIDLLLKLDAGKLATPTGEVELPRLTEITGEKFMVKVKALTPEINSEVQKEAISIGEEGLDNFDLGAMQIYTVLHGVTEPNLKAKELLDHYGVPTPIELINKIFLPGEVTELFNAINNLSTYGKITTNDITNK